MKEVLNVTIELETKEVLDSYKEKLDYHDGRIVKLEIDSEVSKEKFISISSQLDRIENNALSTNNSLLLSNNSVLQTMNKIVEGNTIQNTNKTEIIKIKSNNAKEIMIKILAIIGGLITVYFSLKGIGITI